MKKNKKIVVIVSCIIASLLLIAGFGFGFYHWAIDPYRGTEKDFAISRAYSDTLTQKEVEKDLEYVIDKLRSRHPAWLEERNPRVDEVEERYTTIKNSLTDTTVMEFYKQLGYMLNPLHDGHTYIAYYSEDFLMIDDTSYLKRYGRPTHINGEPIEKVLERYLRYESYEIEEFEIAAFFDNPVCFKDDLEKIDVDTKAGVTYTYIIDGVPTDIHHDFRLYSEWASEMEKSNPEDTENKQDETEDAESQLVGGPGWVRYSIDVKNNLGIFVLTTCVYNDVYRKTVDSFFKAVSDNNITNIAVDLRDNGGGNSWVADYFLRYLNVEQYDSWDSDVRMGNHLVKNRDVVTKNKILSPTFQGDLYVLTNRRTFSAAKDFTMLVMDNSLGKVVGQASSNLPDTYGDCLYFALPNSRLNLSVSYKRWYRIDKTKTGQPLIPDVECDQSQALEQVYEIIRGE